ncbi:unnamed product [Ostreococcus tauri]|uniref:Unnamed product n=1 Tax=Ostreococcus tauri TaxID=70448 RepID=A0A090M072_OSTTA|nr:unnamed product [Ostreococcus tauri]CEF97576.1 unnamed product [Ostreococcus tauri]|eukprot:XP_022838765.1 unnamed product [Ostreococcus tauri]
MRERISRARAGVNAAVDAVASTVRNRPELVVCAVCVCVASVLNPTSESFHRYCVSNARDVVANARASGTSSWACSNGGALRATGLRAKAYETSDLFAFSVVRANSGKHFIGILGTWIRVPEILNLLPAIVVHVYRVHVTALSVVTLGALAIGAPLWSIALCAVAWGWLFKTGRSTRGAVAREDVVSPPSSPSPPSSSRVRDPTTASSLSRSANARSIRRANPLASACVVVAFVVAFVVPFVVASGLMLVMLVDVVAFVVLVVNIVKDVWNVENAGAFIGTVLTVGAVGTYIGVSELVWLGRVAVVIADASIRAAELGNREDSAHAPGAFEDSAHAPGAL